MYGPGQFLIKFPGINLNLNNASGAVICLHPALAACSTPPQLCNGPCTYAIIKSGK